MNGTFIARSTATREGAQASTLTRVSSGALVAEVCLSPRFYVEKMIGFRSPAMVVFLILILMPQHQTSGIGFFLMPWSPGGTARS